MQRRHGDAGVPSARPNGERAASGRGCSDGPVRGRRRARGRRGSPLGVVAKEQRGSPGPDGMDRAYGARRHSTVRRFLPMIRSVVVLVSLGAVATRLIVACSNETCAETLTCPASPAESATGATEAGLVDAEPSVQDASTDVDGSNLDSGTETDATTDAPWEADTGPAEPLADAGGAEGGRLGYCESLSPAPAFCDDFDEHAL